MIDRNLGLIVLLSWGLEAGGIIPIVLLLLPLNTEIIVLIAVDVLIIIDIVLLALDLGTIKQIKTR